MTAPHGLASAPAREELHGLQGLSDAEAARRLREHGPNELPRRGRGRFAAMLEAAAEPMILLLLACGGVYFLLGDPREGLVLLASVVVIIAISLYQTQRSARALAALRDLASPRALVVRDGREQRIAGREIVPGDLAVLAEGDRVPADGVVLSTVHLEVDESLLTGESAPVRKTPGRETHSVAPPGRDAESPFVYSGTVVVAGQAVIRVLATSGGTELGRIGRSLAGVVDPQTPLQRQVAFAVKVLGAAGVALCLLIAILYAMLRANWLEGALAGLALAMSLMPEEFPLILTLFVALGAWRIARRNVLVRHMPALETLGSTTVLCVDKTGTLTENRMQLAVACAAGRRWTPPPERAVAPDAFHRLLEFAVLASQENPFDPMEQAINTLGREALAGTEHLHATWTLVRQYPLSPTLLAMSHVWRAVQGQGWIVAAKGAPEAVVDLCHLGDDRRRVIADEVAALAAEGLRVLAVAAVEVRAQALPADQHDFPFEFLGLLGFTDPIRPGVRQSVAGCHRAGLRVVMITGDYPATARAVAAQIGLAAAPRVLTGAELDAIDEDRLAGTVSAVDVFARVVPEQKLRLVRALRAADEVVAMTGDGVNDAPALRAADIGIAMGRRGTDVAREAADLVLVDDDFTSIAQAVRLGRRIYDNIRKAMRYVVSVHVSIAGLSLLPVLLGWPLVLLPLHIVFLELIIDPTCSIAFEAEPEEPDVMNRPPRGRHEAILNRHMTLAALAQGGWALLVVSALLVATTAAGYGEERIRTVVFSALVMANLGLILASRSGARVGLRSWLAPNATLWAVGGGALAVLATVITAPPLRALFRLAAPSLPDLSLVLAAGAVALIGFDVVQRLSRIRSR